MYKITKQQQINDQMCCWLNLKKLFKSIGGLAVVMLFLLSASNLQAQVTLTSSVRGGFGVDADVRSNELGPIQQNPMPLVVSDDWFVGTNGGNGVIDITGAPAYGDSNANFTLRQVGGENNPQAPYVWIDAVYNRDQHQDGNLTDASWFTSGSDSNADNPTTWTVGEGSGGPQKNDIIDTYLHVRQEIAGDQKLWAYFGVSTRATNGTSYLDVEFYRKGIDYDYTSETWTAGGMQDGRTAYTFVPAGEIDAGAIIDNGDVSFSMNYENGGGAADVRVFIWMDLSGKDDAWFAQFNTLTSRPFDFGDGMGGFPRWDGGEGTTIYGYAQIQLDTEIFAQVNEVNPVDGPNWGTITPGGGLTGDYATLQFAEFAVDGSFLSLDINGEDEPCEPILSSVMVKTRSSTSFVSELKDLVGPFQFGNSTPLEIDLDSTPVMCDDDNGTSDDGTITVTVTPSSATVTLLLNGGAVAYTDNGNGTYTYNNLTSGDYTVRAQLTGGCYVDEMITVAPADPLRISVGSTPVTCDDDSGTSDDGTATVTIDMAGSGIASILWDDPLAQTTATATDLAAGDYNVLVTDTNGCTATLPVTVAPADPLRISVGSTPVTCDDDSGTSDDGTATVTIDMAGSG
ncbi:carboxypeptidase-like regulatory domain-containing protein, partial [Aestuariivivens marinum]|uniref:carboxypeptidase-like regulatory domain-containing protein n=1 Tax=Aestuariivivens marinum TaxID=2913555 RepID=UPI001F574E49